MIMQLSCIIFFAFQLITLLVTAHGFSQRKRIDFVYRSTRRAYEIDSKIDNDDPNPPFSQSQLLPNSFLILNSVAVLWGTQHVVIKSAIESYPETSLMNFWRFTVSAVLFTPALISTIKNNERETWRGGIELGIYTFLGFAFQAVGLETTTASRSAFLLYLNVKIVPFLAAVFLQREITPSTWGSAFLALSGTCLLSTDGGPINIGDFWCIAAAAASALFILRLEAFSRRTNAANLNGVSFAVGMHILSIDALYNAVVDTILCVLDHMIAFALIILMIL